MADVTLPNGTIIRGVPEGTTKDQVRERAIAAGLAKKEDFLQSSLGVKLAIGLPEAAATVVSSMFAEPAAGYAGMAAMLPGSKTSPSAAITQAREGLTYEPRSIEGKQNIGSLANLMEPISALLQRAEQASGDLGYDIAGPLGGAIGAALPTGVAELLGLKSARTAKSIAAADIPEAATQVLDAGKRLNVPVLTTDVIQPTTFAGKFAQSLSEKLGPLGSGGARAIQQQQREAIVQGLADEFEVDLESDFAGRIVRSMNEKSTKALKDAGEQRSRAVTSLDKFGPLPLTDTSETIATQLARQQRLGDKADTALVDNLNKIGSALQDGDFSLVKDIRTEVISDLRALNRSDDPRAAASLQAVKSAIDRDMMQFARTHDRTAARDWLQSNRAFANELGTARDTELRRVFNKGDVTPEVVMPILKGGKRSELLRLKNSLTPSGREAAKAAIIQDALKDSGFFSTSESAVNPDRFATAMSRPNRTQAMNVFFGESDGKQMEGLVRLLNATKRAQQSSAAPATGVQTVPLIAGGGIGAAALAEPLTTLFTVGTLSGIAKAYESKPLRSLLLRLANSRPGSQVEFGLLESSVPALTAALQAAKESQQQTEQ